MLTTFGDIVSRATQGLGNRADVSLSDASFWANQAIADTWQFLPFNANEKIAVSSTTSGGNNITLPTDFQELVDLSDLSVSPPRQIVPTNAIIADSWVTTQGAPEAYHLYADYLELYPSPDSSYSLQLRYRAQPSVITSLSASPSISTRYRYAAMMRARALIAEHVIFDEAKARESNAEFSAVLQAMPSDRALRTRDQHYMGVSIPTWNNPVRQSRATQVW